MLNIHVLIKFLIGCCLVPISSLVIAECSSLAEGLVGQYPTYKQGVVEKEGRAIAWARVGPEKGVATLYAHGNPGSRLELLFFHDQAIESNRTVYLIERAGFGCSAFDDSYSLTMYAEDAVFVLESLGVKGTVDLVGWSSGGPPTLALAYYYPEKIRRLIVASSYTNFGELPEATAIMSKHHRPGPILSSKAPRLFHGMVGVVGWASQHLPNVYFKMTEHEVSLSDQGILEREGIRRIFMLNQEQAFAQSSEGAVLDLEIQWRAWPFSLREVTSPVLLLYGTEDRFIPEEFMTHMQLEIPNGILMMRKSEGHLFPLKSEYQSSMFHWLTTMDLKGVFLTK